MPITIRPAKTIEDCHAIEELVMLCWGRDPLDAVPSHVTMALIKYGGNVLLALDGDLPIGFCLGFDGRDSALGEWKHHSHMAAVHPDYQSKGIGTKIKLAQRDIILQKGLKRITWTFDPLETLNARMNLTKLGGVSNTFLRDVYGERFDKLALGLPTDRFLVDWWIDSTWVDLRLRGKGGQRVLVSPQAGTQLPASFAMNSAEISPTSSLLYPGQINADAFDKQAGIVQIPKNFQLVKKKDMALAKAWRQHTRDLFEQAFANDFTVVQLLNGDDRHYYILSKHWDKNPTAFWYPDKNR